MTVEMALVFLVTVGSLYLFATEKLPLDVTALLILVTIIALPLLFHSQWLLDRGVDLQSAFPTVSEGLSGLSNKATVTVLAMFILSAGIQRSGLIYVLGQKLFPILGRSELRQMLAIALLVAPISGFINNTAAVAVSIPLVMDMARRSGTAASRLLIPLSFFGMMGGTLTVIGTSTNILASSILGKVESFQREIEMFEFSLLGLIVLATGLVYFLLAGRWLLPAGDRRRLDAEEAERFVVELRVAEGSELEGSTLAESDLGQQLDLELVKMMRGTRTRVKQAGSTTLKPGDVLLVRATLRQVMDLLKSDALVLLSEFGESRRVNREGRLVRVLLRNRLVFNGRNGQEVDFWKRYRARLVGFEAEQVRSSRLADENLHVGEIALLEMSRSALEKLRRNPDLIILETFDDDYDRRRMWLAGGIVAAVVASATLTPLPIVVTALMGVIAMVISGCLGKQDLYTGVSWDVIFLLAGVIPLGIAMTKSGAAGWLAGHLAIHAGDWHPVFVLMALYAVTTLLTELVSNNASVVILVPVAVSLSELLGLNVFPLVLAVMFAASTSFLSPVGYQTNTMIYGTGLYRFTDFARVGAPLNVILMVVTTLAIDWIWPLQA